MNVCDERIPSWHQNLYNQKRRNELQFSTISNQFEKQNGLWTPGDIQLWKLTNFNKTDYIDGLMQKWHNSTADTWELCHF